MEKIVQLHIKLADPNTTFDRANTDICKQNRTLTMVETQVTCSNCEATLSFESILNEVIKQDVSTELVEEQQEMTIDCPNCGDSLIIRPSEIAVEITLTEALKLFSQALSEIKGNHTTDWEAVIEREREQAERADRIDELARNL